MGGEDLKNKFLLLFIVIEAEIWLNLCLFDARGFFFNARGTQENIILTISYG